MPYPHVKNDDVLLPIVDTEFGRRVYHGLMAQISQWSGALVAKKCIYGVRDFFIFASRGSITFVSDHVM